MHLEEGAVVFVHLCRPEAAVDVGPFVLAQVQQPSCLLQYWKKRVLSDKLFFMNKEIFLISCSQTCGAESPYSWHSVHCLISSLLVVL